MRRGSTQQSVVKIREEFPKLRFKKIKDVDVGEDHAVFILDDMLVFRFPRNEKYKKTLAAELKLLKSLSKRHLPFAIPQYCYIAGGKEFGGYPLIKGRKMTRQRFSALTRKERRAVISQLASFLTTLHSVPANTIPAQKDNKASRPELYAARYWKERRRVIASAVFPKLLKRLDAFFSVYAEKTNSAPHRTIIHRDLRDEHVLLNPQSRRISGIIDFGDATIGDPAFDFTWLWEYGKETAEEIYRKYRGPKDAEFLKRSHAHYLRWMADEFYYAIKNRKPALQQYHAGILAKNLPFV